MRNVELRCRELKGGRQYFHGRYHAGKRRAFLHAIQYSAYC